MTESNQAQYIGSVSKNEKANCLSGSIIIEGQKHYIDIYPRNTDGKKWYSVRMKKAKVDTVSIDEIEDDLVADEKDDNEVF